MSKDEFDSSRVQTDVIHADGASNETSAVSPPIWQTTTFRAETSEHFSEIASATHPTEFYTRYGNPTHKQVEAIMTRLEGGEAALVASSGMGAIFSAVMSLVQSGDHVVAQRNLYPGSMTLLGDLLPRWGIECTFVDQTDMHALAAALRPNTKLIYAETPTNPLMQITDLRALATLARERGITTIVDNTFATPVNQRPLEFGIDAVVHSATKYLGGHHDLTAGVIVASRSFIERAWKFAIVAGATLSPFDGWLLLRGLRTLGLRVERHNGNALALARMLESHRGVERVFYPGLESHPQHDLARRQMNGFTGILSVELSGGFEVAEAFIGKLKLAQYAASLGGYETLVVHPAAMWRQQVSVERQSDTGVSDSLVRISVGLEDERDLLDDFARALEQ